MTADGHDPDDRSRSDDADDGGTFADGTGSPNGTGSPSEPGSPGGTAPADGTGPGESRPDRPPTAHLLRTLRVPRNAKVGLAVGLALAALAYAVRVAELLGPFRGTQRYPVIGPEGYFLMLAFVLATATAILVAAALTVVRVVRLTREVDAAEAERSPPDPGREEQSAHDPEREE